MKRHLKWPVLWLIGAASACGGPPRSADVRDCHTDVFYAYGDAQRDWQRSLRQLISVGRPGLDGLAEISSELQLALIEQARARYDYLREADRGRVQSAREFTTFVNVGADWTPEDETELVARDADYASLASRIEALRAQIEEHRDWPALRTYVANVLASDQAYVDALARLRTEIGDLEARLAGCAAQQAM